MCNLDRSFDVLDVLPAVLGDELVDFSPTFNVLEPGDGDDNVGEYGEPVLCHTLNK